MRRFESSAEKRAQIATAEQAAEWYLQNRRADLTDDEHAAFIAWLQSSPLNVREYLAISALTQDLRRVLEDDGDLCTQPCADTDALPSAGSLWPFVHTEPAKIPPSRRLWPRLAAAAGCVCLLTVSCILWRQQQPLTQLYRTAHGEQSVWRLRDGSVMHLNTDSTVAVRFSPHERMVELRAGQAFFEVSHDPARRFRVTAGNADVIAVGTQFEVDRSGVTTVVTVLEGRVAVLPAADRTARGAASRETMALSAGQQLRISTRDEESAPQPVNVSSAAAWVRRQIIFDHEPLAQVVEEFNRYAVNAIHIDDPALAQLRVSGVFNAYDTESFLDFLRRLGSVQIQATAGEIHVTAGSVAPGGDAD